LSASEKPGPWPARLDLLQSVSGLLLGLFMWLHMLFVSSILLGEEAMWTVARFFEGYFFFGYGLPWLVSLFVAGIFGCSSCMPGWRCASSPRNGGSIAFTGRTCAHAA
jgi:succinate dehydrogenase/fumarate reductase cytochrome b subunit